MLADKGYLGTCGATAPSNTGTWCVPPGEDRRDAVERRWHRTGGVADRTWMLRTVDQSYPRAPAAGRMGLSRSRATSEGSLYIANLRGPDYMRFMRARVLKAGVRVLDHHPALELLSDGDAVTGAAGIDRRSGADWRVRQAPSCSPPAAAPSSSAPWAPPGLTGDGLLMAAEAGASLSGMEFTGKYTLAPYGSSLNKGLPFRWASFHREDGTPILDGKGEPLVNGIGGGSEKDIVRALLEGPVYARLDLARAGAAGLAAAGPAQRDAALRPPRHRPLHRRCSAWS